MNVKDFLFGNHHYFLAKTLQPTKHGNFCIFPVGHLGRKIRLFLVPLGIQIAKDFCSANNISRDLICREREKSMV